MRKVLIVANKNNLGGISQKNLHDSGVRVDVMPTGYEALKKIRNDHDIILLDISLLNENSSDVLREIIKRNPDIPVFMISGYGDASTGVEYVKVGAAGLMRKPVEASDVIKRLNIESQAKKGHKEGKFGIMGSSSKIKKSILLAGKYAMSDLTVLIYGESGTGKELFARAIHKMSRRSTGPYVTLDCAVIPENLIESALFGHKKGSFTGATEEKIGKFEMADGGTLFLDEIQNLSPSVQAKLLRVIEKKQIERVGGSSPIKVDIRLVAATNVDIKKAVKRGDFREDLYYRLNQITMCLPPLRERVEDIEPLALHFLSQFSIELGRPFTISKNTLDVLKTYYWPGNVRELESVVKSSAILSEGETRPEHLPDYLGICRTTLSVPAKEEVLRDLPVTDEIIEKAFADGSFDIKSYLRNFNNNLEKILIEKIMTKSSMTRRDLAKFLNIDPKTLRSMVDR